MANLLRSNKYQSFSDEKILSLFNDHPKGEAKHFLQIEVDARGLEDKALLSQQNNKKKGKPLRLVLSWLRHYARFYNR